MQGQYGEAMQQEPDKGQELQRRQGHGGAFIVARQAMEARDLGEAALHHPPSEKENKTPFGFG